MAHPSAVPHVGFFNVLTQIQTAQLRHHSVADIAVVFATPRFQVFDEFQLNEFLVQHKVQGHEVRPALLHCARILLEGTGRFFNLRFELAAGVTNDLVECGVNFARQAAVRPRAGLFYIIKSKLIGNATAPCLVVGIDDVAQADTL